MFGSHRRSLATKIVVWSFIPTAIILVAVALVNFYAYQQVTEELVIERDVEVNRLSASQFSSQLEEYVDMLEAMARTSNMYAGDPRTQQEALQAAAGRLSVFDAGVVILDAFGRVVAAEPERPGVRGQDWSDRAYYRELVRAQIAGAPEAVFSDIVPDGPNATRVVVLAAPITGEQLEFVGALLGMFHLGAPLADTFYGDITVDPTYEDVATYIVDGNGRVIFHTDPSEVGRLSSRREVMRRVVDEELGAIRAAGPADEDILASHARVPGTTWSLITEVSWDALSEASRGYQTYLLLLLGLGVVVPALVVLIGVRRVMEPIQELIQAAKQVAQGRFGQTIRASTGDEIEELAEQFNLMSAELEKSYATLEQRVRDRTQELSVLNAIAAVVSRSLDIDEILKNALGKTLDLMEIEAGGIYLLDPEKQELSLSAHQGLDPDFIQQVDHLPVGEGFSGRVAETGEPIIVHDISSDERLTRTIVAEQGFHSAASFPLLSRGRVLGALFAIARDYREFSLQDIELLTSIGQQIGIAVENARLFEDVKDRLAQLTALQDTTTAVVSTLELDELLSLITHKAVDLLNAAGGVLNLVDWEAAEDEVVASTGSVAAALGFRSPLEGSLSGWVALNREAVLANDVEGEARIDQQAYDFLIASAGVPVRTTAAAPLSIKDQVLGSLVVMDKDGGSGAFTQADLELLKSFASQAAAAIENARLFESELRRAEQFQVISEVGRQMTSIMALDELLKQMVGLIRRTFDYYIVEIALIEDGELSFQAGEGGDWNFRPGQFHLPVDSNSVTGAAAATGEAQLVPDIQADSRYVRLFNTIARSELAVPLMTKDKVIGVLNVESDQPGGFDQSDVDVLQSLANQAAVAIENARLYARAQQVAAVEERQRIARDLHDAVTQTLFSSTLIAEVLPRLWERDHEEGIRRLEELRQLTRGALAEMRTLLVELMPAALADADLPDLMRQLSEATTGRARVPVRLEVDGHRPLPSTVKVSLYRIAQEALNNVAKHSAAESATILLRYADGAVILCIADDGRGFETAHISPEHLGLSIMRERAESIGAEISMSSQPGEGTEISVVWRANSTAD